MIRVAIIVAFSLLFFSPVASAAGGRVALVIGVDTYEKLPASAQLRVAVSDAELIADTLRSLPEPFQVMLLKDVTREDVSRTMDQFITAAEQAECAIVYFAGHGIEFHGENYLLLKDTGIEAAPDESVRRVKERFYYESLAMRKVLDDLEETKAKLKLVILDACRDNPIDIEGPSGTRSVVGSESGLARVTAPSGMLISYSADEGEQANDGLFTAVLSRHMKMPGKNLMEVFAMTRAEVRKQATLLANEGKGVIHEPAEYSKLDPGALGFSFSPAPAGLVKSNDPAPSQGGSSAEMAKADAKAFQSKEILEAKMKLAEVHAEMDADRARYREALNVINTLTYNKTRPVVQGSPEYHKCLAADKVMADIEKTAPSLKAEEKKLKAVLKALGVNPDEEDKTAP
ncbi:MAG: caspase family protein [Verrucomicrobiales bacterium]|nr:caspase family protein [Verrucomicrobiales bacterium]